MKNKHTYASGKSRMRDKLYDTKKDRSEAGTSKRSVFQDWRHKNDCTIIVAHQSEEHKNILSRRGGDSL